jgi:hypothetical protein
VAAIGFITAALEPKSSQSILPRDQGTSIPIIRAPYKLPCLLYWIAEHQEVAHRLKSDHSPVAAPEQSKKHGLADVMRCRDEHAHTVQSTLEQSSTCSVSHRRLLLTES